VDILVKLKKPEFLKLAGLLNHVENILKKKVDITTRHSRLSPRFLNRIEKEIRYA
jgi:predicted nucleotidyltransferase